MPTKVYEKDLLPGVAFLLIGLTILLNTPIIDRPVRISEKGLLLDLIAVVPLFFSIKFITRSIRRQ